MKFITLHTLGKEGEIVLLAQSIVYARDEYEGGRHRYTHIVLLIGNTPDYINVSETAMEVRKAIQEAIDNGTSDAITHASNAA